RQAGGIDLDGVELVGGEIGHQRVAGVIHGDADRVADARPGGVGRLHDGYGVAQALPEADSAGVRHDAACRAQRSLRISAARAETGIELDVAASVASVGVGGAAGGAVAAAVVGDGGAVAEAVVVAAEQVALATGRHGVAHAAQRVVVAHLVLRIAALAVPVVTGRAAHIQRAAMLARS